MQETVEFRASSKFDDSGTKHKQTKTHTDKNKESKRATKRDRKKDMTQKTSIKRQNDEFEYTK